MRYIGFSIPLIVLLSGCGDPLAGVEKVSDGAIIPDEQASAALPSQQELERETSILSGLFRRRADVASNDVQTDLLAGDDTVAAPVPDTETPAPSIDAALIDPEVGVPTPDGVMAEAAPDGSAQATADDNMQATPDDDTAQVQGVQTEIPEPKPKGVFGWLRRAAVTEAVMDDSQNGTDEGEDLDLDDGSADPDADPNETPQLASLNPEPMPVPAPDLVEPQKRKRLFGKANTAPTAGMILRDVTMGAALPFGEVGRVCGARTGDLGKLVDEAARKGAGYRLFDSAPDTAHARTFYVTGFKDNCARQFTAALAIFGTPEFHEQLRYGLPAKEYPYSSTDKAYEKVKNEVCNVGRNAPCGARISRLDKTTVFISVYENFGENARWADMLLHDGALLASAVKTP